MRRALRWVLTRAPLRAPLWAPLWAPMWAPMWALVPAALCAGCGYSTGLQLAPGHDSIGVELFRNDSPLRDLERDLHRALARSTRNLVDAPLVSPEQASVVVRGRILDFHRRGGVRTQNNQLVETGVIVRVESSLWDGRTGALLVAPVASTVHVGFVIDGLESEEQALRRALDNLADAIVLELLTRPQEPPDSVPEEF